MRGAILLIVFFVTRIKSLPPVETSALLRLTGRGRGLEPAAKREKAWEAAQT
jgi:hypothetical protein